MSPVGVGIDLLYDGPANGIVRRDVAGAAGSIYYYQARSVCAGDESLRTLR